MLASRIAFAIVSCVVSFSVASSDCEAEGLCKSEEPRSLASGSYLQKKTNYVHKNEDDGKVLETGRFFALDPKRNVEQRHWSFVWGNGGPLAIYFPGAGEDGRSEERRWNDVPTDRLPNGGNFALITVGRAGAQMIDGMLAKLEEEKYTNVDLSHITLYGQSRGCTNVQDYMAKRTNTKISHFMCSGAQMSKEVNMNLNRRIYADPLKEYLKTNKRTFWTFVSRADTLIPLHPVPGTNKARDYLSIEEAMNLWADLYGSASGDAGHSVESKVEGYSSRFTEILSEEGPLDDNRNANQKKRLPLTRLHRNVMDNDCHVSWWEMEEGEHAFVRVPFMYALLGKLMMMEDCEFPNSAEFPTLEELRSKTQ